MPSRLDPGSGRPAASFAGRRRSARALRAGGAASTIAVRFDGITEPVEFCNCPEVLDTLSRILRGWSFEAIDLPGKAELSVSRRGGIYRIEAPWLDAPILDAGCLSTTCSFVVDIVSAFLKDNPALLCLHCGAAMFGGRTVVFPSTNRAGKSTLVSRLAAEGLRIVADDLMPLTPDGDCVALGIAPRLRMPLPEGSTAAFRGFVKDHAGPGDGYYQYLDLPQDRLACHGERAAFGAIVVLDRNEGARAAFEAVPRSEALMALIRQNFAGGEPAGSILRRLSALVRSVPAVRLRYGNLDEATALLASTFGTWPPVLPHEPPPSTGSGAAGRRRAARRSPSAEALPGSFVRHPGVTGEVVDGQMFLSDRFAEAIVHLNPIGTAIWNLLAEPTDTRRATDTICLAFPRLDRARVAADVERIFADLLKAGLVVPHAKDQV